MSLDVYCPSKLEPLSSCCGQAPAAAKEEAKGQQVPLLPPGQLGDLLGPYAARAATPGGLAGVGPIPHPQDTLKLLTAAYA